MFPIQPIALEFAVLALGLFMLLFEAFLKEPDKRVFAWGGISGLSIVLVLSFFTVPQPEGATLHGLWSFYTADSFALFFKRFSLLTTILVLVMSVEYRDILLKHTSSNDSQAGLAEFFSLPVIVCAGLMWLVSATDFIMVFISLELVTIGFYVLVSFMRRNGQSLEAGAKYLILGALSTGFLVYGITWIYGLTGQTNFQAITSVVSAYALPAPQLLFGLVLVLIGLAFKVAAVPFHVWVPDVYQGAPTPTTAFLSVGSKAAGFVVLIRVVDTFLPMPEARDAMLAAVTALAALTLVFGNLAAMPQNNLKRLLAYSSIGHAGYLLVGVAALSDMAVGFYLAAYLLMTLLAFLVLIVVARATGGDDINDFRGLQKRSPLLAFGMLVAMVSLAGLPFTAGFIGKFFIFFFAVQQGLWWLIALGIIAVGAGFYYYLKVVRAMFWQTGSESSKIETTPLTKATIATLCALILFLGIFPEPILAMLRS